MLLLSVAGLALGRAQASLLSIPGRLQTPVVVMSALGNVGNLPLVLVPTIAANPAVGPLDSEEGLRYVLLTYFWACFMQFPLAYTLFGNAARQAQADAAVHTSQLPALSPPPAAAAAVAAAAPAGASPAAGKQTVAAGAEASAYGGTGGVSSWGRASTSSAVQELSSGSNNSGSSSSKHISPHSSSTSTSTSSSSSNGAGSTTITISSSTSSQPHAASQPSQDWSLLARNVLNPPVMACIAAAAMGSLPALQHALFMPSGEGHTGVGCLHTGCGGVQ